MRGREIWSPRQLLEEVERQQVTVMNLPPTVLAQALGSGQGTAGAGEDAAAAGDRGRRPAGSAGGAAVARPRAARSAAAERLRADGDHYHGDAGRGRQEQERITIGRPLPGRSVYIPGSPRPAGAGGSGRRVAYRGRAAGAGYLISRSYEAALFADPFGAQPGGGCTGPVT